MSDLFLSKAEMVELTGYRHAGKQVEILRKRGIAFFLNGRGQPKVSRSLIESGSKIPKIQSENRKWQPAALRQT